MRKYIFITAILCGLTYASYAQTSTSKVGDKFPRAITTSVASTLQRAGDAPDSIRRLTKSPVSDHWIVMTQGGKMLSVNSGGRVTFYSDEKRISEQYEASRAGRVRLKVPVSRTQAERELNRVALRTMPYSGFLRITWKYVPDGSMKDANSMGSINGIWRHPTTREEMRIVIDPLDFKLVVWNLSATSDGANSLRNEGMRPIYKDKRKS